MGLNFQGPKGEKVFTVNQGNICCHDPLLDLFQTLNLIRCVSVCENRVIPVCQDLPVLPDKWENRRDHLRQRSREETR